MSKKLLLVSVLFMGVVFNSCNKIANQLAQSIGWAGVDVTVTVPPVSDTTLNATRGTGSFTYNLDSFIMAKTGNALGMKNIDTFTITSCMLTITDPVADINNNFGNFQSASASFFTNINTTMANMGEVTNNPSTMATTLSLPINNTANLRPYLPTSGPVTVTYSLSGKLRKATTVPITVNAHIEYHIHVTP